MKRHTKTVWISHNGLEFDSAKQCRDYELEIKLQLLIDTIVADSGLKTLAGWLLRHPHWRIVYLPQEVKK